MGEIKIFDKQDKYFYSIMGEHFANKQITKEMDAQLYNEKNTVWLLFMENKSHSVQGFISLTDKGQYYYIDNFYVLEPYRKKGVAAKLLEIVMNKPFNYKAITRNEHALKLFKSHGFKAKRKNGRYHYLEYML